MSVAERGQGAVDNYFSASPRPHVPASPHHRVTPSPHHPITLSPRLLTFPIPTPILE
ncbi:hypothetical protein [Trichormus sp. NMC-1]|uniref:hypothetical protein n=1 Tax=Trichormus sp. NMC-1 TaxID=1853259 RepID=UPI001F1E1D6C|nr:hypothetical protein [Trichormus sp. NMC-1]